MSEKGLNLSRRKFMAVSSAAIAAPILMNMGGGIWPPCNRLLI
jgi:hypothetical protein